MEIIFKKSTPGSLEKENEDNFYVGNNYCVVLDGATSLIGNENVSSYTKELLNLINKNYSPHKSLKYIVKKSIKDISLIYQDNSPSACIVMIRVNNDSIDFLNLGDSSILYKNKNNQIFILDDTPNLFKLDKLVYQRMEQLARELNITPREARNTKEINDLLLKHRNMKNTKEGYYVLDTNPSAVDHASTWTINKNEIDTILLATDGLTEYYNEMHLSDYYTFYNEIEQNAELVFQKLKEAQINDSDLNNIRFKISDDTTGILIKIN